MSTGGPEVAILSYHKIGEPPDDWWSWFYVPEDVFAAQLRFLRTRGWEPIDARTLLRGLDAPQVLPRRSVLVTFDDAYRSFASTALPWLRKLDVPAVVFVPTDFIGGLNAFDLDVEPEEPICRWQDLRELQRAGVSVQSHTASHRTFSKLAPDEQEAELRRSKALLEDALESPVELVAYPYGDMGRAPETMGPMLERAGYRAGCLYGGGVTGIPPASRARLPRLAMGPDTDLERLLPAPDKV